VLLPVCFFALRLDVFLFEWEAMTNPIEVKSQQELDEALKKEGQDKNIEIYLRGNCEYVIRGSSQVRACGSSQVTAYGSSQVTACDSSQVTACDSSQVRACGSSQVTACDSSQVTACGSSQVTAYGSSQVTACDSSQVRACGSSQVRAYDSSQVRAYDSSQVTACDSSQVRATKYVAITKSQNAKAVGGMQIKPPSIKTAKKWCENYGVEIKKGIAILFKGVDNEFKSHHNGFPYVPGTTPEAPDWDGGKEECGGGLHFSPTPAHTLEFNSAATKFVACPVAVKDIAIHKNPTYPSKVKAKRLCAPCWEVDIHENKVEVNK